MGPVLPACAQQSSGWLLEMVIHTLWCRHDLITRQDLIKSGSTLSVRAAIMPGFAGNVIIKGELTGTGRTYDRIWLRGRGVNAVWCHRVRMQRSLHAHGGPRKSALCRPHHTIL
jgi:hypothetical protein